MIDLNHRLQFIIFNRRLILPIPRYIDVSALFKDIVYTIVIYTIWHTCTPHCHTLSLFHIFGGLYSIAVSE